MGTYCIPRGPSSKHIIHVKVQDYTTAPQNLLLINFGDFFHFFWGLHDDVYDESYQQDCGDKFLFSLRFNVSNLQIVVRLT